MAAQEKEKPAPPLAVGGTVADKYRIEQLLGEGGMGFVFEATHLQLGHRVALKVLNSAVMADREVVERFLREGRALARLSGEHIARVSDVGTLPTGEPYMVMEFLEGRDLARELSARGPMPLVEVIEYMAQTCEALAEAHVRGIVHRDLKPANLFLTQKLDGEACIKVLDFGISKFTQEEGELDSENITVTSSLVGTPKYMSPEQIQDSRNVDSRTDIWGLGTIFYELLTQTRPFAAPSLALVCVKILHEEIPAPSAIKKEIPQAVDAVIARCLKKAPGDRYQSVGELVDALVTLNPNVKPSATRVTRILAARNRGSAADSSGSLPGVSQRFLIPPPESSQPLITPSNVRPAENAENATLTAATLVESGPKKKNRLPIMIGAAAGGALLLGMILFFAFHSSSSPKSETTQPTTTTATSTSTASATVTTTTATASATVTATATETATAPATGTASARHLRNNPHVHVPPTGTATNTGTENVLDDRR
jgi:serine/threonine-protein kinase